MGRRSVAGMLKLERVISVVVRRVRSLAVVELENLALRHQRSPWQKAYVERVIGSIRRECLDHIVIFNERHLRRVLSSYIDYYQRTRTHLSLNKDCPHPRPIIPRRIGKVIAIPKVGGLHHRYERLAASRAGVHDDGVGDRGRGEGPTAALHGRVQAAGRARGGPLHHDGGDRGATPTRGAVLFLPDDVASGARSRRTRGADAEATGAEGGDPRPARQEDRGAGARDQ